MTTERRRVSVLTTGGTISSMPTDQQAGVVPSLGAEDLLASIRTCSAVDVTAHSFRAVASSDLSWLDVVALAGEIEARLCAGADGVVVVQGTDTIEETAFALDLLHRGVQPIVVTGAMRHPSSAGADGPANLEAAIALAASSGAEGCGVLVAFGDEVHAARWVRKVHTSKPAAFASPTAGALGWVVEGRPRIASLPLPLSSIPRPSGPVPPVALLAVPLGDDARLAEGVPDAGYAGLVVEALGGGHVPSAAVDVLARVARRIPVVLASRCPGGEGLTSTYGFPGSERDLLVSGLVAAGALSPAKARVLLSLLLATHRDSDAAVMEFCEVRDGLTG